MAAKRKILVAEDDSITRELLRILLTKAGYDVVFAEDGQSAVDMAISEKPDLVLSDGLLPKIHGFLVCQAIKQFCNPPKVILLTGIYTKPAYKWEAKTEYGADDWLTKPFNTTELLACIERHLSDLPLKEAVEEPVLETVEREKRLIDSPQQNQHKLGVVEGNGFAITNSQTDIAFSFQSVELD